MSKAGKHAKESILTLRSREKHRAGSLTSQTNKYAIALSMSPLISCNRRPAYQKYAHPYTSASTNMTPSVMRNANPPRHEVVASTKKIQPSISSPREWTVGSSSTSRSSSTGKSTAPVERPSRSCTSLNSTGYDADKEDNDGSDDQEDIKKDNSPPASTVTTSSSTLEEPLETTPPHESLNQEKPGGNIPAPIEGAQEAESEVDIEDLLLDLCEPHGLYWNTSEEGTR